MTELRDNSLLVLRRSSGYPLDTVLGHPDLSLPSLYVPLYLNRRARRTSRFFLVVYEV